MNDPWADVREGLAEFKEQRGTKDTFKAERLLADADALLEVINISGLRSWAVTITEEWNRVDSEQRLRMYASMKAAEKILAAIAALPEHLKREETELKERL